MRQIPVKSLAGIEEFSHLEQIGLSSVTDGDLSPLLKLAQLDVRKFVYNRQISFELGRYKKKR